MDLKQLKDGNISVIEVSGIDYLDVSKTFDCGQCFRFDKVQNSSHKVEYAGVAHGRYVAFASDSDDTLYIYNSDMRDFEDVWLHFLCLDLDYGQINKDILEHSGGSVMEAAMEYGRGIRILKQDSYEAVISFIISQNNNIPRIKKIIEALSERCGEKIMLPDGMDKHMTSESSISAFPTLAALDELGEAGLFEMKTGFRAKYIYDAVCKLGSGELDLVKLQNAPTTAECIDMLCKVKGIGLKVASCAALFGMAKYDAFPVDVWMRRVADKYFPEDTDFNGSRFGKYAGIAQQYLFYYERYQ